MIKTMKLNHLYILKVSLLILRIFQKDLSLKESDEIMAILEYLEVKLASSVKF